VRQGKRISFHVRTREQQGLKKTTQKTLKKRCNGKERTPSKIINPQRLLVGGSSGAKCRSLFLPSAGRNGQRHMEREGLSPNTEKSRPRHFKMPRARKYKTERDTSEKTNRSAKTKHTNANKKEGVRRHPFKSGVQRPWRRWSGGRDNLLGNEDQEGSRTSRGQW